MHTVFLTFCVEKSLLTLDDFEMTGVLVLSLIAFKLRLARVKIAFALTSGWPAPFFSSTDFC